MDYFESLYALIHLNSRKIGVYQWKTWVRRRQLLAQRFKSVGNIRDCVRNPYFRNIQVYLARLGVPRLAIVPIEEVGTRFVFITIHHPKVDIDYEMLPNLIYIFYGLCEQNIEHTHIIMGFSYPKNYHIIRKAIQTPGRTNVTIDIESIHKSVIAAHQYIKNQVYEFSSVVYKIASNWEDQKYYRSYISERKGLTPMYEMAKGDQHDLPYHLRFHNYFYYRIPHPRRWNSESWIYIVVESNKIMEVRDKIISLYFNSEEDVFVYDDESSIIWKSPTYGGQPIIIITSTKLTQFPIVQDNTPFIICLSGTWLADANLIPFGYQRIYQIDHLISHPIKRLSLNNHNAEEIPK
jgi:hypothetical protein